MSDRFVRVRYSKDGGNKWSFWRTVSLGELGQYQDEVRVRFRRIGMARTLMFDIEVSSPIRGDLLTGVAQIEGMGN